MVVPPTPPIRGDQGFLNAYFSGFSHSPQFDPTAQYTPDQYKVSCDEGRKAMAKAGGHD